MGHSVDGSGCAYTLLISWAMASCLSNTALTSSVGFEACTSHAGGSSCAETNGNLCAACTGPICSRSRTALSSGPSSIQAQCSSNRRRQHKCRAEKHAPSSVQLTQVKAAAAQWQELIIKCSGSAVAGSISKRTGSPAPAKSSPCRSSDGRTTYTER